MTATQVWNSRFSLHWNPLVAFMQRRGELANWIDQNIDARGVLDQEDVLGVAVSDPDLRVTVSRSGFDISLGGPHLLIDPLQPLISGIIEVVKPAGVHMASGFVSSSTALVGEYDSLRSAFARRCFGLNAPVGFETVDASVLADLKTETGTQQVEFGVVTDGELMSRLEHPEISRLVTDRAPINTSAKSVADRISPVGLFCDSVWRCTTRRAALPASDSSNDIWHHLSDTSNAVVSECLQVLGQIADSLHGGGEVDEHSVGA